ncbi:hypothetical protein M9Y10_009110 [Tritrichomonas musculus]|uniref:Uncharacterized protein n=1 Tax=Tritrichomonas musculus TaxID=1915356 RepID=A0ABR2IZX3_9EUKA
MGEIYFGSIIHRGYQSEIAYEVVPLTSIYIYHRQNSNLISKKFISKNDEICTKYGKIIIDKKYCDTPKKRQASKGVVSVLLFSSEIAIPFVTEVRYAIFKGDQMYLHFPSKMVSRCLINRHDVIESINQWIHKYKLNIKRVKSKYAGTTQEIPKVNKLLLDEDTQPNISYKCISIPGGIEISKVDALISPEWVFDKPSRLVYIPQNSESKTIGNFNEKIKAKKVTTNTEDDSEIAYDYMFCCESEATLSGYQMPFYQKDCVFCAYEGIRSVLDTLFGSQNDRPRPHLH